MFGEGSGSRGALPGALYLPLRVCEPETLGGGCSDLGACCVPALQGCLDRTGGEGRGPKRPGSPPPPWLVWMPEQPCLGPGNKSEALGRRPGEAGHVPSPPPHGLRSLAASSVFPRGETWFSPGSSGAAGKGIRSLPAPWWSWRPGPGAVVLWESGGPSALPPERVSLRKGRAARSPAGGSVSQRPPPVT